MNDLVIPVLVAAGVSNTTSPSIAYPVFTAPYRGRITSVALSQYGAAIPVSDTDWWLTRIRRTRAGVTTNVATKTTRATAGTEPAGEAFGQFTPWDYDLSPQASPECEKGDLVSVVFKPYGLPGSLGPIVNITVTYAPDETRIPPEDAVNILAIGDTHFGYGGATAERLAIVLDDVNTLAPAAVVQLGDQTCLASTAEFDAFLDWWPAVLPGTPRGLVPGNHDLLGPDPSGSPDRCTTAQWATIMGQDAKDSYLDVGEDVRLILLAPAADATQGMAHVRRLTIDPATVAWCEDVLDTDRRCVLFFHAPLPDTVGPLDGSAFSSYDEQWTVHDEAAARLSVMIAAHPNILAWVASHTHPRLTEADIVKDITFGDVTIRAISITSPTFSNPLSRPIASAMLSITATGVDVYRRDHGAHQWV